MFKKRPKASKSQQKRALDQDYASGDLLENVRSKNDPSEQRLHSYKHHNSGIKRSRNVPGTTGARQYTLSEIRNIYLVDGEDQDSISGASIDFDLQDSPINTTSDLQNLSSPAHNEAAVIEGVMVNPRSGVSRDNASIEEDNYEEGTDNEWERHVLNRATGLESMKREPAKLSIRPLIDVQKRMDIKARELKKRAEKLSLELDGIDQQLRLIEKQSH